MPPLGSFAGLRSLTLTCLLVLFFLPCTFVSYPLLDCSLTAASCARISASPFFRLAAAVPVRAAAAASLAQEAPAHRQAGSALPCHLLRTGLHHSREKRGGL